MASFSALHHRRTTTLRTGIAWLCVTGALASLSACSSNSNAAAPPSQVETLAPTTTEVAVTTTEEATTTTEEAATTTAAPTTTVEPIAPIAAIASNVEIVGRAPIDIVPVGKSNGADTMVLQERLNQLGFWSGAPDGQYGFATVQAVMAFQKYIGLPADGRVDATTAAYLTEFTEKAHGAADTGTLVEVDKRRQLLFIVVDGKTQFAFNTSTGSEVPYEAKNKKDPTKIEKGDSVTPNGLWEINRQRPDGWWEGDLGEIYRPKYFIGGVAIHGMTSVPNYPASHGCVRLSTMAMDFIWDWDLIPLRTPVWVHE